MGDLPEFDPNKGRQDSGDRVSPTDLVGSVLLVKVRAVKQNISTAYGTKDAVDIDVAGVTSGKVARGLRWFNGALVDSLAPYEGQTVPVKLGWATGASGRAYIVAEAPSEIELAAAQKFWKQGDPFAAEAPDDGADEQSSPSDEGPRW